MISNNRQGSVMNPEENQGNTNQVTAPPVPPTGSAPVAPTPQLGGNGTSEASNQPRVGQPMPPVQPVEPAQSVAPQPPQNQPTVGQPVPQQSLAPMPKKGTSKTALYGIIAGVVGALLVIVVVVLVVVMGGPSKEDFRKASGSVGDVVSAYEKAANEFNIVTSAMSYSGQISDQRKSDFKSVFVNYKAKVAELKDAKALRDKEVKSVYDVYMAKNEKFIVFVDGIASSMDDLAMAKSKCNISPNTFSNATPENMMVTFDNAIVPCQKALDNLKDVKNTVIAKYARDVSSQIRDFRIARNAMVDAYKAKDAAKYTAAKTELIAIGTKLDTSETALQENLKKDVEGVKVKTELQKLRDIVDQKANK